MTKEGWIYLVQNFLGGGSAPSDIRKKYRKGIVSSYLGMSFNEALSQIYLQTHELDSLNSYAKIYADKTLQIDQTLNKKYIAIPTTSSNKILQIPDNKAIRTVIINSDPKANCLYRNMNADQVYDNLEVGTYEKRPRWDLLGERIYFSSHITVIPYSLATTCNVIMIVPWSEFNSDEDIQMPFENNNAIFDSVVAKIRSMGPADKIIDQNVVQPIIK